MNQDTESFTATLNCMDGGHMVMAPADSTVQVACGMPISVTINVQTVNYGVSGNVTLPDNSVVAISWQNVGTQVVLSANTSIPT